MAWEPIFILLSDWYNKCLNEKILVVLIIAMALIRFLCKRQMENFYLSSSPGSSTVGATGAALLWARCHCLPCNVCSHFPFAAICFLSTSFPTQGRNFGCQEHLHRLPLGGLGPKLSVVRRTFSHCCNIWRNRALNAQWISAGARHWALQWQLLMSHHPTPLLSDVSVLFL